MKYAENYNENEVEPINPYWEAAFHLKSKSSNLLSYFDGLKVSRWSIA